MHVDMEMDVEMEMDVDSSGQGFHCAVLLSCVVYKYTSCACASVLLINSGKQLFWSLQAENFYLYSSLAKRHYI